MVLKETGQEAATGNRSQLMTSVGPNRCHHASLTSATGQSRLLKLRHGCCSMDMTLRLALPSGGASKGIGWQTDMISSTQGKAIEQRCKFKALPRCSERCQGRDALQSAGPDRYAGHEVTQQHVPVSGRTRASNHGP